MVRTLDGGWEVLKTSCIAPPDVYFWNVVAAREHTIADAGEVELDIFCSDVDQHNLKVARPRLDHQS